MQAIDYAGNLTSSMHKRALEVFDAVAVHKGVTLSHIWGVGSSGDHALGKALDFMVFSNEAAGHYIANYLMEPSNRSRLGVRYIMWQHRIWNVEKDKYGVWRWVPDRGNSTKNHMDHVHVSFYDKNTPYVAPGSTKPVDKPKPQPKPKPTGPVKIVEDGKMGPATIRLWQTRMKAKGYDIKVDGKISANGSMLVEANQHYLNKQGVKCLHGRTLKTDGKGIRSNNTGDVGPTHTIEALQKYLGVHVDGVLSHRTSSAVRALQKDLNADVY